MKSYSDFLKQWNIIFPFNTDYYIMEFSICNSGGFSYGQKLSICFSTEEIFLKFNDERPCIAVDMTTLSLEEERMTFVVFPSLLTRLSCQIYMNMQYSNFDVWKRKKERRHFKYDQTFILELLPHSFYCKKDKV